MKSILVGVTAGVLIFIGIFVTLLWQQTGAPLTIPSRILFHIAKGESVRDISADLQKEGTIKNARIFYWYAKFLKKDRALKAGVYELLPSMHLNDLIPLFENGSNASVKVTIPEGFSLAQIALRLKEKGLPVREKDFALSPQDAAPYQFLRDAPPGASLEGFLFPSTYDFFADASAKEIRETLLASFQNHFDPSWYEAAGKEGKTVFEVVTMASILEKELRSLPDKKIAAGLLWRRLSVGIPLQVDSTINYITGKNTPALNSKDASIASPYNTYKNKGLPPGPISNPGTESIEAALFPQASEYWFYLSRQDTGETIFSKTLQEQAKAKGKYLK